MTILFVADNIGGGGKERRMIELVKSLCKDPAFKKIILISLMDTGIGYEYIYQLPITIIEVHRKGRFSLKPYRVVRDAIKQYKPDIVHSWGSMGSAYMLPLLVFRKFRFINGIIADAPNTIHWNWLVKPYLRGKLTYPFSDVVLSNSLAGIKSYGAPLSKTKCIYNGIDMNRFRNLPDAAKLKQQLGIEHFSYVVGMVGAFQDRKDYVTFTQAAKRIIQDNKSICFLMVGDGHNRAPIEATLSPEEKKNILSLGRRSDVEALIQVFNVGVLCTNSKLHGEGVSNSIIEYMSLKKPVIATEGGGTNEVIEHGVNGYMIGHNDEEGLIRHIQYLYQHPEVSSQMGEHAYATIQQKFLLDRMTQEFIDVYNNK